MAKLSRTYAVTPRFDTEITDPNLEPSIDVSLTVSGDTLPISIDLVGRSADGRFTVLRATMDGLRDEDVVRVVEAGAEIHPGLLAVLNHAIRFHASTVVIAAQGGFNVCSLIPLACIELDDDEFAASLDGLPVVLPPMAPGINNRPRLSLTNELLARLTDRIDGTNLLAEAIAEVEPFAQYVALLRFFERAFAKQVGGFTRELQDLLDTSPHGFTRREVQEWMEKRPRAMHADRRSDFLLDGDVAIIVNRMFEAAYWVLMNKAAWRALDGAVRESLWGPLGGTLGSEHGLFSTQGEAWHAQYLVYDPWLAFPLHMGVEATGLVRRGLFVSVGTPGGWCLRRANTNSSGKLSDMNFTVNIKDAEGTVVLTAETSKRSGPPLPQPPNPQSQVAP